MISNTSVMLSLKRNTAQRITIIYLIFGLTWIFVTDYYDSNLTGEINWFQLMKGSVYVVCTAILFYFTVRSISNKLDFSELILKQLSDNYQYSIALIDENQKIIFFNKRLLEIVNKKPKQVVGKKLFEFFHKTINTSIKQKIDQFYNDKQLVTFNEKLNIKGEESYVSYSLIPIFNNSKQFEAMLFLSYNLTEEHQLRLKNEKLFKLYTNVFTASKKNILLVDANYQIIEFNEINKTLFSDAFLNLSDFNIDLLENLELKQFLKKHIFETFNFNKNQSHELKIENNYYFFDFCLFDDDEKQLIQIIITDITPIKTIEKQFKQVESKLIQSKLNLKIMQEFVDKSKQAFSKIKNIETNLDESKLERISMLNEIEKMLKIAGLSADIHNRFQIEEVVKEKSKQYPTLQFQIDLEQFTLENNKLFVNNLFEQLFNIISKLPINADEQEKRVSISGKVNNQNIYEIEINDNSIGLEIDEQKLFKNEESIGIAAHLVKLNMLCNETNIKLQLDSTPNRGNSWVLLFE